MFVCMFKLQEEKEELDLGMKQLHQVCCMTANLEDVLAIYFATVYCRVWKEVAYMFMIQLNPRMKLKN